MVSVTSASHVTIASSYESRPSMNIQGRISRNWLRQCRLILLVFLAGEYANVDHTEMIQTVMQKCQETEALCNEFYLQLIKQTTDHPGIFNSYSSL